MLIDNQICAPFSTLSQSLDKYLALRGVEKKKYYPKYLIAAGKIWEEIFQKTIWVTQAVWKPLLAGDPYPYVQKPAGMTRLFSVSVTDECGNIVPLYFNTDKNVVAEPKEANCKCGCAACDGLCEDLSSMVMTTQLKFSRFGVDYYEKTWLKYCPNGDIIEYREVPTIKYNDRIGETGDYNQDYNNDYNIGNPAFSNSEIVTVTEQKTLCKIDVKPCGCPENTEENRCKIIDHCLLYLRPGSCCHRKHCNQFLPEINGTKRGQVALSECGTKILYIPRKGEKLPKHLLINHQTDGKVINQETTVPNFAEMCLWTGIDYLTKKFNNSYGMGERQQSMYAYNHEQNEIIKFLSPLSLRDIAKIQDAPNKW